MAIMDLNLMFTAVANDSLNITTSTASSQVINLGAIGAAVYGNASGGSGAPGSTTPIGRDIWVGSGLEVPKVDCIVYGSPVGTSTPTLNFQLQGNSSASSAADAGWYTISETGALTTANLSSSSRAAGVRVLKIDLPGIMDFDPLPLYLRINVAIPAGSAVTTGSYFAGIVLDEENWNANKIPRNFSA
jgi:hypothetical protein